MWGDWGLEFNIYTDLGAAYNLPLYDEDPWMVQKGEVYMFLGSQSQMNFVTPGLNLSMYMDVWGLKATFMNAAVKFNTVDWSMCKFANWFVEVAKAQIYTDIQVNECMWGLASYLDDLEDAYQCQWREYSIEDPLFQVEFSDYYKHGEFMGNSCDALGETTLIEPEYGDEVVAEEPVYDDYYDEVSQ